MASSFLYKADPEEIRAYLTKQGYETNELIDGVGRHVGFSVRDTNVELSYDLILSRKRAARGLITLWKSAIEPDVDKRERSRKLYRRLYRRFRDPGERTTTDEERGRELNIRLITQLIASGGKAERKSEPVLRLHSTLSNDWRARIEDGLVDMLSAQDENTVSDGVIVATDLHLYGNPLRGFEARVVAALENIIARDSSKLTDSPTGSLAEAVILALGEFHIEQATPFLKDVIARLSKQVEEGHSTKEAYGMALYDSWVALARLDLSDAIPYFHLLLVEDLRTGHQDRLGMSGVALIPLLSEKDIGDLRSILEACAAEHEQMRDLAHAQLRFALERLHENSRHGVGTAPAPDHEEQILSMARQLLG